VSLLSPPARVGPRVTKEAVWFEVCGEVRGGEWREGIGRIVQDGALEDRVLTAVQRKYRETFPMHARNETAVGRGIREQSRGDGRGARF